MGEEDKYWISEAIELHFTNQSVVEVSDRNFGLKSIGAIWEEVYILPEYRAGRRFTTRLDAEVAADLQSCR